MRLSELALGGHSLAPLAFLLKSHLTFETVRWSRLREEKIPTLSDHDFSSAGRASGHSARFVGPKVVVSSPSIYLSSSPR